MMYKRIAALAVASLMTSLAVAQDAQAPQELMIELNTLASTEQGCGMTFLIQNSLPQSIDTISLQLVMFNAKGQVEKTIGLPFRDLPTGKDKVRQFNLPGLKCETIKGMLINDITACEGNGVDKAICTKALKTRSKTDVTLQG
ncbi:hypothetical protein IFT84_18830 [Rhizobium sp. CFBP 8762]|uniref:hypothetical protein n=1 Tax=Rhizobium sp. CFBP 8762 TaxID=2775279 RepID=UPI0017841C80|nr:hypothetical protein [Rhizobium sp. CFBP 8762]MBD8556568.1 hypothetical protein [Rhizobium sp. CFBP 8762]